MDRRQLIRAANAVAVGAFLPASARAHIRPGHLSRYTLTPVVDIDPGFGAADATPSVSRIGVVSVGGIGGLCFPVANTGDGDRSRLDRTIAIHDYGVELHFMEADRKILVGDGKTPFYPLADRDATRSTGLKNMVANAAIQKSRCDLDLRSQPQILERQIRTKATPNRVWTQTKPHYARHRVRALKVCADAIHQEG